MSEKKNPKKQSVLVPVQSVLQSLFAGGKSPLSDQFLRWKLWRDWEAIVGQRLARTCVPVELERNRLLIWVKSSGAVQDLSFVSDGIAQKVNVYLGRPQVQQIRCTTDRTKLPPPDLVRHLDFEREPEAE